MSEADLNALEGIVKTTYSLVELKQGVDLVKFLAETGILSSKGEARKMIQNGGISINRNKVEDIQFPVGIELLIDEKYILVQKGKEEFLSRGSHLEYKGFNVSPEHFKKPYFCGLFNE